MWNNFKNNLRNSPVSHRETISAISWGKDGQKLPLRFFFLKAPEDRTLLWKAAAGSWQLLPFRELETKAICKCLLSLGKHWFASLCQRSGFSWGQGKDFSGHHSRAMPKQPKLYSWNSKLGLIFLTVPNFLCHHKQYQASFNGFRNLLASRNKLWTSGSGTPQLKSKPAPGKAHLWTKQVNNSCQICWQKILYTLLDKSSDSSLAPKRKGKFFQHNLETPAFCVNSWPLSWVTGKNAVACEWVKSIPCWFHISKGRKLMCKHVLDLIVVVKEEKHNAEWILLVLSVTQLLHLAFQYM